VNAPRKRQALAISTRLVSITNPCCSPDPQNPRMPRTACITAPAGRRRDGPDRVPNRRFRGGIRVPRTAHAEVSSICWSQDAPRRRGSSLPSSWSSSRVSRPSTSATATRAGSLPSRRSSARGSRAAPSPRRGRLSTGSGPRQRARSCPRP
jgi:hypothetical protein